MKKETIFKALDDRKAILQQMKPCPEKHHRLREVAMMRLWFKTALRQERKERESKKQKTVYNVLLPKKQGRIKAISKKAVCDFLGVNYNGHTKKYIIPMPDNAKTYVEI